MPPTDKASDSRYAEALEAAEWTDEYVRDLNTVIHAETITPLGAYCVGVVTTILISRTGRLPSRELMEQAASCVSVYQAVDLAEEAVRGTGKGGDVCKS